jgi:hypothetical protein
MCERRAWSPRDVGGNAGELPQTPPYQWWNYHDTYGQGA